MWIQRYIHIALAGFLAVACPAGVLAQRAQDGQSLLEAGKKSLAGGNFKLAIKHFSRAMRSNTLSTKGIAKALLNRGIARRELDRPAHAIADLDSAIWLGELPSALAARAHFHRGLAYRAVGMEKRAGTDFAKAKELAPGDKMIVDGLKALGKGATTVASRAPSIPSFTTTIAPASKRTRPAPRSEEPKTRAPAPRTGVSIGTFQTEVRQKPEPRVEPPRQTVAAPPATALPRAPAPAWTTSLDAGQEAETKAPASAESRGNRVSRFLGGIWGSSSKKKPETTENQNRDAAPPSNNERQTTVAGAGTYRLQLASVKSQDEAQKVWQRLAERHKDLLDGRQPTIKKTTLGTLGTFYRLQIGPFADKSESLRLCNSFKRSGVECFLITH